MKTPEDEAFEDIERRQGGFQAKRQMAADKVQDEIDMLTIAYLDGYEKGKKAVLAQPAQEPAYWLGYGLQAHTEKPFDDATPLYTTPSQRPLVGLTAEETSGFTSHEMTVVKYVSKVLQEKNNG